MRAMRRSVMRMSRDVWALGGWVREGGNHVHGAGVSYNACCGGVHARSRADMCGISPDALQYKLGKVICSEYCAERKVHDM